MSCPYCAALHPISSAFCPATGKPLVWDAGVVPPLAKSKGVADLLGEAMVLYRTHARALLITCALLFVPASLAKSLALSLIQAPLMSAAGSFQANSAGDIQRLQRSQEALRDGLEHHVPAETLARLEREHAAAAEALGADGLVAARSAVGSFGTFLLGLLATFVTSFFLYGLIVPLTNGALTISVADRVLGGKAEPREVWMLLLSRVGTLLPTVLLSALVVAVGFLFFVLPGLVLAFLFAFVSPVVLIERKHGIEALKRSAKLVQSDWLRVVLVLITFGIVRWFAQLMASLLVPSHLLFVSSLMGDLITLALMPVPVLGLVLIYMDIRRQKEGLAEEGLRAELATLKTA